MDTTLSLIVIRVIDLEASVRFYSRLGLDFTEEQHGTGPIHFSAFVGETLIELYPASPSKITDGLRLGFMVSDLNDILPQLTSLGGKLISAPTQSPWGYRAVISDLDGHTLELTQDQPR